MSALRVFIRRQGWLAALLLALSLGAHAVVPVGYMPVAADGGIAIAPCAGYAPLPSAPPVAEMPAMVGMEHMAHAGHGTPTPDDHAPAQHSTDNTCAFAGFSAPLLGGSEFAGLPVLVAADGAFEQIAPARIVLSARPPRPPSRGPPILA